MKFCFLGLHKLKPIKRDKDVDNYSTHECRDCKLEFTALGWMKVPTYSLTVDQRKLLAQGVEDIKKRRAEEQKVKKMSKELKFSSGAWPPPLDRREAKHFLFGFDEENQPYILHYEQNSRKPGWVATTLDEGTDETTAQAQLFTGETVDRLMRRWADAPLLANKLFGHEDKKSRSNTYV